MTKEQILMKLKDLLEKLEMGNEEYIEMRKNDNFPLELNKESVFPSKVGMASGLIQGILEIEGILEIKVEEKDD